MPRLPLITLWILLSFAGYAQVPALKKNIIKASISDALFSPSFSTVHFAYERLLGEKFSIIPELGVQLFEFPQSAQSSYEFVKPRGYKAAIETRYYFKTKFKTGRHPTIRIPIGINLYYRRNQFNDVVSYYTGHERDFGIQMSDDSGAGKVFGVLVRS